MLVALSLFIKNVFGWCVAHWRLLVYAGLACVVLIMGVVLFRSCGKKTPKLDQQEIIKAQQAIEEHDRKTMIDTLANSDVREKEINGELANAKDAKVNAIADSKTQWANANNQELADELERRAKESQ
jgi:hypothetical protein